MAQLWNKITTNRLLLQLPSYIIKTTGNRSVLTLDKNKQTCTHIFCKKMSRLMTKLTKWHVHPAKTQISPSIRPVWSVFADAQADLSLCWANMPFCWFCHEEAGMWKYGHYQQSVNLFNIHGALSDYLLYRILLVVLKNRFGENINSGSQSKFKDSFNLKLNILRHSQLWTFDQAFYQYPVFWFNFRFYFLQIDGSVITPAPKPGPTIQIPYDPGTTISRNAEPSSYNTPLPTTYNILPPPSGTLPPPPSYELIVYGVNPAGGLETLAPPVAEPRPNRLAPLKLQRKVSLWRQKMIWAIAWQNQQNEQCTHWRRLCCLGSWAIN